MDLYGNYQAILDDISKNNYDEVICLGDIIGISPKPKETLKLISDNKIDIVFLFINNTPEKSCV